MKKILSESFVFLIIFASFFFLFSQNVSAQLSCSAPPGCTAIMCGAGQPPCSTKFFQNIDCTNPAFFPNGQFTGSECADRGFVPPQICGQTNTAFGWAAWRCPAPPPTPTPPPPPTPAFFRVQGRVWNDNNNNGVIDGTDTVRSGNSVFVQDITGGGFPNGFVTTDGTGFYQTSQIYPDTHFVSSTLQNPPAGCSVFPGNPSNGFITGSNLTLNFMVFCPAPPPTDTCPGGSALECFQGNECVTPQCVKG